MNDSKSFTPTKLADSRGSYAEAASSWPGIMRICLWYIKKSDRKEVPMNLSNVNFVNYCDSTVHHLNL